MRRPNRIQCALGVIALTGAASSAAGATFTVTSADDAGAGTLRQAILDANASPGDDRIEFSFDDDVTISLASTLPDIDDEVLINGKGDTLIAIDGPAGDFAFRIVDELTTLRELDLNGNQLEVRAGAVLAIARTTDDTVTVSIIGDGDFEKRGPAEYTIQGAQAYTGDTVVRAGLLRGDTLTFLGHHITIEEDALVAFNLLSTGTYAQDLRGEGGFEKEGAATLILTGTNTHTGGTRIRGGRIIITTSNLSGDVVIDDDAVLEITQGFAGTYAGGISGDGALVKDGIGAVTLTGTNSYGGGTQIVAGELRGDTQAVQGDVRIDAGAVLTFDQPGSGSYSGDLSGAGNLVKEGSGTVTLTGNASHTGGTDVVAGTLRGDTDNLRGSIVVVPGATVEFDQSDDGTLSAQIMGGGELRKDGSGTLTIQDDQAYTGTTTVAGGTLRLDAALDGDVDVDPGGTLAGTGSVRGALDASGRIAPSGSGTLSVGGGATFASGSTLAVSVDDAGVSSRVDVTEAVTLNGGTVEIALAPGDYSGAGVSATILTAADGTGGAFDGTAPSFAFLDTNLSYPGFAVVLDVVESAGLTDSIDDFAETPNQVAVANAFEDMLRDPGDSDVDTVRANFVVLTEDEVAPALESMAGDELAAFQTARLADAERFARTLGMRFDQIRLNAPARFHGDGPAPRAAGRSRSALAAPARSAQAASPWAMAASPFAWEAGPAAPPEAERARFGGWLDFYSLFGEVEGGGAKDIDYNVYAPVAGIDVLLADRLAIGGSFGYARTSIESDGRATGDANTYQGALYGAFIRPDFYVGAAVRYGWSEGETRRALAFSDLSRRARGQFESWDVSSYVEAAYSVGTPESLELQPVVGLLYTHLDREDFTESGAQSLDLAIDGEQIDSLLSILGIRLRGNYEGGEVFRLLPYLQVAWEREYLDTEPRIRARFRGAGSGGDFTVVGADSGPDKALVGIGWEAVIGDFSSLTFAYDARVNAELIEHSVAAGIRVAW